MGRADLERRRTGLNALTATARRSFFAMTLSRVPSRSQTRSHAVLECPPHLDTQPSWLVACLRCLQDVRTERSGKVASEAVPWRLCSEEK